MFLCVILAVYEPKHAVQTNTGSLLYCPCVTVTRAVTLLDVLRPINLGHTNTQVLWASCAADKDVSCLLVYSIIC